MGTQHHAGRKRSFTIDPEWEDLAAPMFCDFTSAEFVGQRLGGHLREESSSSSFFANTNDTGMLTATRVLRAVALWGRSVLQLRSVVASESCRLNLHRTSFLLAISLHLRVKHCYL